MLKRFLILLAVLLGLILAFQYIFLPIFLRHEKVQEKIFRMISEETKGTVQFSDLSLRVFPSLSFQMKDLVYESKNPEEPITLQADLLKARLELLPIFRQNIKIKDLTIKNASIEGETGFFPNRQIPFQLKGFSIEARGIRKESLGSFRARGKLFSEKNNFEVSGSLRLGDVANFKLEDLRCDLKVTLNEVPLEPLLLQRMKSLPVRVIGGDVTGTVQILKKTRERKGEWAAELKFKDILYADPNDPSLSFPPSSQEWSSKGSWDADKGKLSIFSSKLLADGLDGELIGDFLIQGRELQSFDTHVAFKKYDFDKADQHFPFLNYWFQTGVDVEGQGEVRFQTKGDFNSFQFQGEIVLNDAAVDYAYFQKSKGKPLILKTDVRLENKTKWSGEFDFRYQEMKIKGALLDFNIQTNDLNFTAITNKFRIDTFLAATASADSRSFWDGAAKVLVTYKGKFGEPDKAKIQGVINMDNIAYGFNGLPLKTPPLTATFKIEDQELYSEESYLQFGDEKAPFELEWNGWENPRISWKATAGTVDLKTLYISPEQAEIGEPIAVDLPADTFTSEKEESVAEEPEPEADKPDVLPPWLEKLKALGEVRINTVKLDGAEFNSVKGAMVMENGKWKLGALGGRGAGGELWITAEQDFRHQPLPRISAYGKRLASDRFSSLKDVVDGTLSFKFYTVREPGPDDIVRGNLLISRGKFENISFLGAANRAFKTGESAPDTDFTNAGFWLQTGKQSVNIGEAVLDSRNLSLKGKGRWSPQENLFFQGEVVFDRRLSEKWAKDLLNHESLAMPVEMKGDLINPEIIINQKSARKVTERNFQKEILERLDYLRFLDRQSPKYMRLPDKTKFLQVAAEERHKPRKKRGFFEILFGRRS